MAGMIKSSSSVRRLRIIFWCVAIFLGIADAWATRQTMNADGIAYLDMGDAYLRGDWHMAINAHWSPVYSWALGLALRILRPTAYWEFPVLHAVNLIIFLGALAAFEFLLSTLVDCQWKASAAREVGVSPLPDWAWRLVGYTLFLWTSFELIGLGTSTPDMCVAAFVYLSAGIVLKVRGGSTSWVTFICLGVVLGLGYLTKAIMFPISFVFLGVTLFSVGRLRKAVPRVLVAAAVFLAVASPFIIALSIAMGRPTFGEAGRLAYIQYVDSQDYDTLPAGSLKHPINRIHAAPDAYEFATPDKRHIPPLVQPGVLE